MHCNRLSLIFYVNHTSLIYFFTSVSPGLLAKGNMLMVYQKSRRFKQLIEVHMDSILVLFNPSEKGISHEDHGINKKCFINNSVNIDLQTQFLLILFRSCLIKIYILHVQQMNKVL